MTFHLQWWNTACFWFADISCHLISCYPMRVARPAAGYRRRRLKYTCWSRIGRMSSWFQWLYLSVGLLPKLNTPICVTACLSNIPHSLTEKQLTLKTCVSVFWRLRSSRCVLVQCVRVIGYWCDPFEAESVSTKWHGDQSPSSSVINEHFWQRTSRDSNSEPLNSDTGDTNIALGCTCFLVYCSVL